MPSLHIIVASTSGHTDYVVDTLIAALRPAQGDKWKIEKQRAETTKPEDLLRGHVLILASSTWNTGGIEGQLNPHMHALLTDRAKAIDLKGKQVAVIGLGDHRYHFTARAADLLEDYVRTHGGLLLEPVLRVVNEPYGREKEIGGWGKQFLSSLSV